MFRRLSSQSSAFSWLVCCCLQVQKWQGQEVQRWETDAGQLGATFLSRCGIDVGKVDLVVSFRLARFLYLKGPSITLPDSPLYALSDGTVNLYCLVHDWGMSATVYSRPPLHALCVAAGVPVTQVGVKVCLGYIRHADGTVEKTYSKDEVQVPLQAVIRQRPQQAATGAVVEQDGPAAPVLHEGMQVRQRLGCTCSRAHSCAASRPHRHKWDIPEYSFALTTTTPGAYSSF